MQMGRRRVLGLVPALGVAACTKEVHSGAPSETPTVAPSSTPTSAPSSTPTVAPSSPATSTPSKLPPALPDKVTSETIPGASGAADITSLRYKTPRVKPADVKSSGAALQRFAAKLWNVLPGTDSNLVVSPYALAAILGILGMGADGELRKQYETVLNGDIETVAT